LGGVLEKRRVKNRVFHAEERIYNLQISLSELISLSGSPLFPLCVQILAQRNFLYTMARSEQFSLGLELCLARPLPLARHKKLLFSKSQRSDCGKMS